MTDWATLASFATAGGTLVLAVSTFSAVRSSNRSARTAEAGLLTSLRPLLVHSLPQDPAQKVLWGDYHRAHLEGGRAVFEAENDVIYMAIGVRNVGEGLALLHGWSPFTERAAADTPHEDADDFRRLGIDLYIPAGGSGYFESAVRDRDDPLRDGLLRALNERQPITVDVLYGDQQGRQHTISRFNLIPAEDGGWLCLAPRHWNLDGPSPR